MGCAAILEQKTRRRRLTPRRRRRRLRRAHPSSGRPSSCRPRSRTRSLARPSRRTITLLRQPKTCGGRATGSRRSTQAVPSGRRCRRARRSTTGATSSPLSTADSWDKFAGAHRAAVAEGAARRTTAEAIGGRPSNAAPVPGIAADRSRPAQSAKNRAATPSSASGGEADGVMGEVLRAPAKAERARRYAGKRKRCCSITSTARSSRPR